MMYTISKGLPRIGSTNFTMLLIYLDESGINYRIRNAFYPDGPFLIMGATFVSEDVYWSLERLFAQLIDKYFSVEDWLQTEVHATDIWNRKQGTIFNQVSTDRIKAFFDEFVQICAKFNLPYSFSFVLKRPNQTKTERNLDILRAAQSLLVSIEHRLASIHQTGILVCDSSSGAERLKTVDIINMDLAKQGLSPSQALLRIFYEMTSWRSIEKSPTYTIQPKYVGEYMSAYLIDRVHFLNSSDSMFLQISDIMTFIVRRLLTHDYLTIVDKQRAPKDNVPTTFSAVGLMLPQIHASTYTHYDNDILFFSSLPPDTPGTFLVDFSQFSNFKLIFTMDIKEHYKQLSAPPA